MTTLMRNGRDRRLGTPVKCHARKERVLLVGTRSADHIRASGQSGRIQRPNTWLHPNASLKCPIFPLHRGRRPYMALRSQDRTSGSSNHSGWRLCTLETQSINGWTHEFGKLLRLSKDFTSRGRLVASQSASAFAVSFLPRLTYGLTS